LDRSLTVLLPVHNAESTLSSTVQEILDVVPELTRRFDLLIIDDGSTDATSEVAQELARDYPQIRVVYRTTRGGCDKAIQAGLERCSSEVVLVRDDDHGTSLDGLHKLWQNLGPDGAPRSSRSDSSTLATLARCRRREPGYRIIHRQANDLAGAAPQLESVPGKPGRPNYLSRLKKFALGE
jgi:hypothetical protein